MDGAPEAACHLVWLDSAPASRTHVGGKSSSLSQLSVLGAPVPPAFAITTHTYAQFAASLNLPRQASDVADEDLPRLRALIMGAALPGPVTESIVHGYRAFQTLVGREVALAVRSARTLTPPPFIGAAPPEPPPTGNPMERANARFFGGRPSRQTRQGSSRATPDAGAWQQVLRGSHAPWKRRRAFSLARSWLRSRRCRPGPHSSE